MSRSALHPGFPILLGTTLDEFPQQPISVQDVTFDVAHHVALAWVFDPARTSMLLIEHPTIGWSCPGGHLEGGEQLLDAARRELHEETGLVNPPLSTSALTLGRTVGCARNPTSDTVHWAAGFGFLVDSTTQLHAEPGARACWFAVDELPGARVADVDIVVARLRASGLM